MADVEAIMPEGTTSTLPSPLHKDSVVAIEDDLIKSVPTTTTIDQPTSNSIISTTTTKNNDNAVITSVPEATKIDDEQHHDDDDDDRDNNIDHEKINNQEEATKPAKSNSKEAEIIEQNGTDVGDDNKSPQDGYVEKRQPLSSVENKKESPEEVEEDQNEITSNGDNAVEGNDIASVQQSSPKSRSESPQLEKLMQTKDIPAIADGKSEKDDSVTEIADKSASMPTSPKETNKTILSSRPNETDEPKDLQEDAIIETFEPKPAVKEDVNGKIDDPASLPPSSPISQTITNSEASKLVHESDSDIEETTISATNGVAPKQTPPMIALQISDNNVVDLDGDDSDDEDMSIVPNHINHRPDGAGVDILQRDPLGDDTPMPLDTRTRTLNRISNDSEGAVIIGSDSENECVTTTHAPQPLPSSNALLAPILSAAMHESAARNPAPSNHTAIPEDDDDDDDCVVIEDDTPAPPPALTISDLNKRKSAVLDVAMDFVGDETQPPIKRQRSGMTIPPSMPATPTLNQIQIKDARSLMPPTEVIGTKRAADGSIYPITITSTSNSVPTNLSTTTLGIGPPKLVPMATNMVAMAANMPGLTGLNANLLPGLTDDMFVLEAPSFIVPYIYEKPPNDHLKEIIKDIEAKHKLTKEDLADADKSDEFDMITEQNKDEKEKEERKKKRKRGRGRDDGDDSWSEDTDDDEDDEDSEGGMRTKVLIKEASDDLTALKGAIKPASAVAQSAVIGSAAGVKPGQENYFESPLGKFFMDIGVGLVQEFVQSDLIRLQKRKMRKSLGKNITEFERAISALSGNLEASKKKNAPFKFTMKRCEFCNFKSESALSMANHYETPHMHGPLYKCNFCTFEIRNATEIVYHMEAVHNIKARLIKPLPYHQCPNCGFEDNGKAKLARHQPVCLKKFRPELNLAPPTDWEAPAKIPRIKPRHGLVGTATAYQAMAAQAAAQKAALASIQQQQQQAAQARNLQVAALAAQTAANKLRGRPPVVTPPKPTTLTPPTNIIRGPTQVRNPMATNLVMPNYQLPSTQLIQTTNAMAKKNLSGQPSISITPLPRQTAIPQAVSAPSTSKMPQAGVKPGQGPNTAGKTQFVICEICDGYIKDLEQLRNHMQWMHKVKIHPKMIYNRPPLNCQKCQFRFFTDQGLERHLLGSHGLVTSSMQEAANKGKDAGRCPVCGRMYQWKLLNHVSRDHHMTLKPAHLSYKCTVCTATFGMYKQFETHVYTAHSTVAKKAMDSKKSNAPSNTIVPNANSGGAMAQRNTTLSAANDSLLKPLKINDEITIIPQPASKTRITNMESHVID